MGLILDGGKFAVLTDILGDEDHLGDMDFKVAGTENGVTALQMDIKIQGITKEIMQVALAQAREGRLHILGKMKEALDGSRGELSAFAPRMLTIKINPEKIRDVIGKGGATIRALTEETGTQIDISDDGTIVIASVDEAQAKEAQRRIVELTADVEVGQVYEGAVLRLLDFGAIVQVLPGRDGLLHISEIANYRIANINDVLKVGQQVRVKVIEADDKGRLRLSIKAIGGIEQQQAAAEAAPRRGAARIRLTHTLEHGAALNRHQILESSERGAETRIRYYTGSGFYGVSSVDGSSCRSAATVTGLTGARAVNAPSSATSLPRVCASSCATPCWQ